ncbi:lipoyl(octanoyl) transferase LipB [bacterium]|nr:lipoyl(octanoyl) transferase LipB [bacterium]
MTETSTSNTIDFKIDTLIDYESALQTQLDILNTMKGSESNNLVWLLSHPPVITYGIKRGAIDNLITNTTIPVVKISRGGDITYHDEGQLTGYFLFKLNPGCRDLHKFLFNIEESIIQTLNLFQVGAHRVEGKTGVFLKEKKVCSIGIACRHWITFHGFSLNFSSNLKNYSLINPCGYESSLMANISQFIPDLTMELFSKKYKKICAEIFKSY